MCCTDGSMLVAGEEKRPVFDNLLMFCEVLGIPTGESPLAVLEKIGSVISLDELHAVI